MSPDLVYAQRMYRSAIHTWGVAVIRDHYGDTAGVIWREGHGEIYSRAAHHVSPAAMVDHLNALAHHHSVSIPSPLAALMAYSPLRLGDGCADRVAGVPIGAETLSEALFA